MSILPPEVRAGYVYNRVLRAIGDRPEDEDRFPDGIPAKGTVTFTPKNSVKQVVSNATGVTVTREPVVCTIHQGADEWDDPDPTKGGLLIDEAGAVGGVWLVVGEWTVSYQFDDRYSNVPNQDIVVTEDHTENNPLDVALVAGLTPSPTIKFVVNEQIYIDSKNYRDEALEFRNEARTERGGAETARTGAETAQTGAETAETNAEHSADRAEISAFNTPQIVVSDEAPETTEHNGIWYDFKPGAVTYAWEGEPHNSESIKYVDGVEVARNIWLDTLLSDSNSAGNIEFVVDGVIVSEAAGNLLIPTTDIAPTSSDANGRNFSASYKIKNLGDSLLQIRIRIYSGTSYTANGDYYYISPGETEIVKIEGVAPSGDYLQARLSADTPFEGNIAHISQPMWQWADSVDSYFDGDTIGSAIADTAVLHEGSVTRVQQPIHPTNEDISRISEGLGLRVDDSVGTRVFIGDTLIHGDTGWRDITSDSGTLMLSGEMFIRRMNDSIHFSVNQGIFDDEGTVPLLRPGEGFRQGGGRYRGGWFTDLHRGLGGTINIAGAYYNLYEYTPDRLANVYAVFATTDSWPTSLPGTEA